MRVCHITCSKYTINICSGSSGLRFNISYFVGLNPWLENIRIRFVTDGQEESGDEDDGIIIGRTNLPIVNRGDALFHLARIRHKGKGPVLPTPDEDEII